MTTKLQELLMSVNIEKIVYVLAIEQKRERDRRENEPNVDFDS